LTGHIPDHDIPLLRRGRLNLSGLGFGGSQRCILFARRRTLLEPSLIAGVDDCAPGHRYRQ
jgi:hypothetical protein